MAIFSALLTLCAGNSPHKGQSFGVFFDLRLNKRLGLQTIVRWWFETPSYSLWRHCNENIPKYLCGEWADQGHVVLNALWWTRMAFGSFRLSTPSKLQLEQLGHELKIDLAFQYRNVLVRLPTWYVVFGLESTQVQFRVVVLSVVKNRLVQYSVISLPNNNIIKLVLVYIITIDSSHTYNVRPECTLDLAADAWTRIQLVLCITQ